MKLHHELVGAGATMHARQTACRQYRQRYNVGDDDGGGASGGGGGSHSWKTMLLFAFLSFARLAACTVCHVLRNTAD